MRLELELKLGFRDVLIRPKRSILKSRSEVDLTRTFAFKYADMSWSGVPVIAANMDTIGTFPMAAALAKHKMLTAIHKHYSIDKWREYLREASDDLFNYIAVSSGVSQADHKKLNDLLSEFPKLKFICIDVANGYTEYFVDFLRSVRKENPTRAIIAGNVVTGEMVEQLIISGADIVKVGIGPGSVCTTRVKTGVGYPQLSAVIECADAAHGLSGQVISDGGCVCPGDIAKAFGGGADFVMLGGMLAGHTECEGELHNEGGKQFMTFYGMSSAEAMEKHEGKVAAYRAAEGKKIELPFRGPVEETVKDFLGGLRSACTYVGAAKLKELSKRTTFIRVHEQENQVFSGL